MSMFSFPDAVKTLLARGTAKNPAANPPGIATNKFGSAGRESTGVNVIPPRVIGDSGGIEIGTSVGVNGSNVTVTLVELFASKVIWSS
jgi:hypothetical protein